MFKRIGLGVVGTAAAAAAIWAYLPGLRTQIEREVQARVGWNEDARRSDPVGFANHVNGKLREDLDAMQKARRELTAEVGQLVGKVREQEALRDQGRGLAEEVRAKFQKAKDRGSFPIEVRGRAYTEAEAKSQISMLLAETKGYEEAIAGLRDVKQRAEEKIETLAVKVNATEIQLVALAAKRGLIEAERLTAEGETLLAQVDALMQGNEEVIEGNPVRTVRELLAAKASGSERLANAEAVETFLAELPAAPATIRGQDAGGQEETRVPSSERPRHVSPKPEKGRNAKPVNAKPGKPIFQQT